jgi:hypothetical protein
MRFRLERVHYMPKVLEPAVLYVAEEFETAAHLCACGCNEKVRTPLGPTEWRFEDTPRGPSLSPSIGSWQSPCKSHYWITQGKVRWSTQWSPEQIAAERANEEARRRAHYEAVAPRRLKSWQRAFRWLRSWITRG